MRRYDDNKLNENKNIFKNNKPKINNGFKNYNITTTQIKSI